MYNFNFKVIPIGSKDAETLISCSVNTLTVAGAERDAHVTTHAGPSFTHTHTHTSSADKT